MQKKIDSVFLDNLEKRMDTFKRNIKLELLLDELEDLLGPVEIEISKKFSQPRLALLLVIGNPRSGTTLMMQYLATTGQFAVPSNLLSRFYYAPFIGAKIQLLLADKEYDYKGELGDFYESVKFESALGKTKGALAPNEFYHFWRRFIPNYDPQYLTEEEESKINGKDLAAEIAAIESVFNKPFAAKAIILQYNIPKLINIFEKPLFIYVRRHPFFTMQSILQSREQFYGTRNIWWSVKPKEYAELKRLHPIQQIAGQVFYTEQAIKNGLRTTPEDNKLVIDYEFLCENPKEVYDQISLKSAALGHEIKEPYHGPKSFKNSNSVRLSDEDVESLLGAYQRISGKRLKIS